MTITERNQRYDKKFPNVIFRLPREEYEKLQKVCIAEEKTQAEFCRDIIKKTVNRYLEAKKSG